MRFLRLDLLAYGGFENCSLDLSAGPRQLHVIYGPNESGKSTALRAITGLLFGIENQTTDDYRFGYKRLRIGATFDLGGQTLRCVRRKGILNTLRDDRDQPIAEDQWQQILKGLNCETFEQQFGLTHQRLGEGGRAIVKGHGDLGQILFAAGAGLERLRDIQNHLHSQRSGLFLTRGNRPKINQQLLALKTLRDKREHATIRPEDYLQQVQQRDQLDAEVTRRRELKEQKSRKRAFLQRCIKAVPYLQKLQALKQQLQAVSNIPLVDKDFPVRRRDAEREHHGAAGRCQALQNQIDCLLQTIQETPQVTWDPQQFRIIRQVAEERSRYQQAKQEVRDLSRSQDDLHARSQQTLKLLEIDDSQQAYLSFEIPARLRGDLDKLLREFNRVEQSLAEAEEQLERQSKRLLACEEKLASIPPAEEDGRFSQLLERIGAPEDLWQQIATAHQRVRTLERDAKRILQQLPGSQDSLTLEQALALEPPAEPLIQNLGDQLQAALRHSVEMETQLRETVTQREQVASSLRSLRQDQNIPSEQELLSARLSRDQHLEQLARKNDLTINDWLQLGTWIAQADNLVDRLRREADLVAQRSAAEQQHSVLEVRQERLQEQCQQASTNVEMFQRRWDNLWKTAGIQPDSPEVMQAWLHRFQALQQLREQLWDARDDLIAKQHRLSDHCQDLREALRIEASASPGEPAMNRKEFLRLYDHAKTERERLREHARAHAQQQAKLQSLRETTHEAKENRAKASRAFARWNEKWQQLRSQVPLQEGLQPDAVQQFVRHLDQLHDLHQQMRERENTIQAKQAVVQRFEHEIGLLRQQFEIGSDDQTPEQIIGQLVRLADQQQAFATEQQGRQQRLERLRHDLINEREAQREAYEVLRGLCRELNCECHEQLPELERKSQLRRELSNQVATLQTQMEDLAETMPLAEFVQVVETLDPDSVRMQVEQLTAEIESHDHWVTENLQHLGQLKTAVRQIDGGDRAAILQQQIYDQLAQLRDHALQYTKIRIAEIALTKAIEQYRQQNQDPLLVEAGKIFSRLTLGAYSGLRAECGENSKDKVVLYGLRDQEQVDVKTMSDGAADALFFSLRLASLKNHLRQTGPFPLIADDILIQLDDDRAAAALEVLSELSQDTQVIMFTHHQHLLEVAKERLPSGYYHPHFLDVPGKG